MKRTTVILTLAFCGCASFDPDLSGLDEGTATSSTGTGTESGSGESSSTDSATSTSGPDMGDGSTGTDTSSTGDGDGDGDTGTDTGQPNFCGDGVMADSEVCDGSDGVPVCEGIGEVTCVNACMEINTEGCDDTGLNPALKVPAQGAPCEDIGWGSDCGQLEVCRLATPDTGICESCVGCLSLNSACAASSDCDILFTCYAGQCVSQCELGNPTCGQQVCTAVGHPTHGVCL